MPSNRTLDACSQGLPPDPVHTQCSANSGGGDGEPAPNRSWETLDGIDLSEFFQRRFRVMQECPHHRRGSFRQAVRSVLEVRHEAVRSQDIVTETRAWNIFCLFPVFLWRRPASGGHVSREDIFDRYDKFTQGEWLALNNDAILSDHKVRSSSSAPTLAARGRAACQKMQLGDVSRARQCLTGESVVQGNEEAFRAMQDRRPQERRRTDGPKRL